MIDIIKESTFISYTKEKFEMDKFKPVMNNCFDMNKPINGLWACRKDGIHDDLWYDHISSNIEYRTIFKLKDDAKIFVIGRLHDFELLIDKYGYGTYKLIDFEEMSKEYDGIYLADVGLYEVGSIMKVDFNNPNARLNLFNGMWTWDIPSLCLFNKDMIEYYECTKVEEENNANYRNKESEE